MDYVGGKTAVDYVGGTDCSGLRGREDCSGLRGREGGKIAMRNCWEIKYWNGQGEGNGGVLMGRRGRLQLC